MVVVPVDAPVTIPVAVPIVAIAGILQLHDPPGAGSDNVIVVPEHSAEGPLIADGKGLIVSGLVTKHPVLKV